MYCSSSVQFAIVERNEIVFLLCQKQPTALKYLLIFHQKRHKQNGSKCTNGNPWTWPLGLYWFPKRSASVKYTTVQDKNFSAFILKVLQSLHKSGRKKKSERDNGLFCVYSECTCVDVVYFVPACTIWKDTGFIMALHHKQKCFLQEPCAILIYEPPQGTLEPTTWRKLLECCGIYRSCYQLLIEPSGWKGSVTYGLGNDISLPPSLPGDRYLNLGSKSDLRAEISGSIVRYDALAPRPEVLLLWHFVRACAATLELRFFPYSWRNYLDRIN